MEHLNYQKFLSDYDDCALSVDSYFQKLAENYVGATYSKDKNAIQTTKAFLTGTADFFLLKDSEDVLAVHSPACKISYSPYYNKNSMGYENIFLNRMTLFRTKTPPLNIFALHGCALGPTGYFNDQFFHCHFSFEIPTRDLEHPDRYSKDFFFKIDQSELLFAENIFAKNHINYENQNNIRFRVKNEISSHKLLVEYLATTPSPDDWRESTEKKLQEEEWDLDNLPWQSFSRIEFERGLRK